MTEIEAKQAVRVVWLALSGGLTSEVIDEVFGDSAAKSLTEVAAAFGVSVATVRHTWKSNGLPSVGKRGSGSTAKYADVLKWLIARDTRNAIARGSDELTKLKKEAETRIAEAEARIKERKAEVTEGEFVPLVAVQATLRGILNVFRDTMLNIPRQLTPMFPAKYSAQWTDEVDRLIRNCLTIIADKPVEDFIERTNNDESG